MKIKQVIVVRKDLNMRKGKLAAQVAHASMKVFFDRMLLNSEFEPRTHRPIGTYKATINNLSSDEYNWMNGAFTKVVVSVDTEDEIYNLQDRAVEANVPCAVIIDNGLTEFGGKKTTTCIALGPASSEVLDPLTGDLPLI